MKRKNETITLKAALVITAATIIILCSMLVNVKADQKPEVNFQALTVTADDMNNLGEKMSPEIMDQVSAQIPSCTPNVFLEYYCKYDSTFKDVIAEYFETGEEAQ